MRSPSPPMAMCWAPGHLPGHMEIYHWELGDPAVLPAPGKILRVTNGGNASSRAPARPTDTTQSTRPEVVAFVSNADLDPSIGNADGNTEIFLWIKPTGEIRQVTDTLPPVENTQPYTSDSGRCLVFSSNGDLNDNDGTFDPHNNPGTGYTNPDGSQEVFLVQFDNDMTPEPGSWTQISNGPAGTTSGSPVIGGYYYPRQCNVTAYMSDYPQVAGASGGTQIYNYKRFSGENRLLEAREVVAPGNVPPEGDYLAPHISSASNFARGPHIVFHTATDMWNNDTTGKPNMNIWRYRVFHPRMTQYTDLSGLDTNGQPVHARNAEVSDGGRWIAFESNGEILRKARGFGSGPFNADANWEVFRIRGRRRMLDRRWLLQCRQRLLRRLRGPEAEGRAAKLLFKEEGLFLISFQEAKRAPIAVGNVCRDHHRKRVVGSHRRASGHIFAPWLDTPRAGIFVQPTTKEAVASMAKRVDWYYHRKG